MRVQLVLAMSKERSSSDKTGCISSAGGIFSEGSEPSTVPPLLAGPVERNASSKQTVGDLRSRAVIGWPPKNASVKGEELLGLEASASLAFPSALLLPPPLSEREDEVEKYGLDGRVDDEGLTTASPLMSLEDAIVPTLVKAVALLLVDIEPRTLDGSKVDRPPPY